MPVLKHKVFAYITHGRRLLVFRHPESPEAGIQVPAGTVQPGEDLAAAVLREAAEETGRTDLVLVRFLGEQVRDRRDVGRDVGRDEIHHRHFYHLRCTGDPPATWRHWETDPSDGSPGPIPFDFFWAPLPDGVPELIAGHGNLLPQLLAALEPDT
ncbi:MAG TPA: NUDIX domain-containing protein [Chloroflexia bacterium]|jgi:8-oxo-dGTP pyrophosphatase MutT (NUDIX family)|nr:NUDIX domain-containing protein [Chloroflexia bacterium]